MSNSSAHDNPLADSAEPPQEAAGSWWWRTVSRPAQAAGFWAGVLLPFVYLPMLASGDALTTVGALIAVHVAALWLGHAHNADP